MSEQREARHDSILKADFSAVFSAASAQKVSTTTAKSNTATKSSAAKSKVQPWVAKTCGDGQYLQHDKTLAELRNVQEVARNRLQAHANKPALFDSLRCILSRKTVLSPTQISAKDLSDGSEDEYADTPCIRDFLARPSVRDNLRPQELMLMETYSCMELHEEEQMMRRNQALPPSRAFLLSEAGSQKEKSIRTTSGSLSSVLPSEMSRTNVSQMSQSSFYSNKSDSHKSDSRSRIQDLKTRVLCLTMSMQSESAHDSENKTGAMTGSMFTADPVPISQKLAAWIRRPTHVASSASNKSPSIPSLKVFSGGKGRRGHDSEDQRQSVEANLLIRKDSQPDKACELARSCRGKRVRQRCARSFWFDEEKCSDHVYVFVSSQYD